jgi:hypothetical protein
MSFFIRKNQRGAKRKNGATVTDSRPKTYKEKKRLAHDDEISSHSEGENDDSKVYSESEDEETVQEKRLRLTKEYIQEIENQGW